MFKLSSPATYTLSGPVVASLESVDAAMVGDALFSDYWQEAKIASAESAAKSRLLHKK